MAKCLQVVGQGVPVRMSDDDAFQVVEREHDGQYCPKKLWREFYIPHDGFPQKSRFAKLVPGSNAGAGRTTITETPELDHRRSRKDW